MEQVGAITYLVDMDTAAVTKGADRVNAALDSVGKGADRLDTSMDRAGTSMSKAAKATDEEAAALRKLLGQIDPTVSATQRLDQMTEDLGKAFDKGQLSAKDYAANLAKLDAQYDKLANNTDKATSSTKKSDSASSGFTASLKPLAAAVAGIITVQTLAQWGKMAEQFTLLQSRITRLSSDATAAAATYQQLLSVASATGQTMPETVKLWETLTNSLKSLGATNAQVLALTGTLQKIGKIGGSSAEETANALRQLGQSLAGGTLRAEEFNSIVEQTPELIRQLASASGRSMGEFRQAMLDGKITSQELFDLLLARGPQVDAEFKKLPRSASDAGNAVSIAFGAALSKLDQALGASQKLARALDSIARTTNDLAGNLQGQEKFNTLIRQRQIAEEQYATQVKAGLSVTAAATKKRLDGLNEEIKKMQDARVEEQKRLGGGANSAGKPAATTTTEGQKVLEQLAETNQQLRAQGVERAKIIALQKLGATATQQEKDAAVALAVENYNFQEAEKARTKAVTEGASERKRAEEQAAAAVRKENEEARKGYETNQKTIAAMAAELANAALKGEDLALAQARAKLNKFASPEDVAEVERLTRAIVAQQQAVANKQLAGQVDPMIGASQGLDKKLSDIKTLEQAEVLSAQRANELRLAAETEYQTKVRALQEENFRQASLGNQLLIDSINSLASSGTQALSGLLSGTMSLKDAMGGIANTVLNSVIGAFVQMGVDWVKQQIMMQTAAAATTSTQVAGTAAVTAAQTAATGTIAATTTTAAATTGTAVATSMAPAAGLASIASFGGAAVIGGAALLATMLLAKSFGGGRQYGGGVAGNKMYRVNEGGAPEIFNAAGGKQYLMPNSRGEVVSNKDATGGGGGSAAPVVNVNNYSGQGATAQATFNEADKRWVVDVVVGDMQSGGRTGQTVNQITGTQRRGS